MKRGRQIHKHTHARTHPTDVSLYLYYYRERERQFKTVHLRPSYLFITTPVLSTHFY